MSDWIVAGFEQSINRLIATCILIGVAISGALFGAWKLIQHLHIVWK